jgi:hypothetical protein
LSFKLGNASLEAELSVIAGDREMQRNENTGIDTDLDRTSWKSNPAPDLHAAILDATPDCTKVMTLCGYFEDAYSLAESGVLGTVDQIDKELLEFAAQFQGCDRFMTVLDK